MSPPGRAPLTFLYIGMSKAGSTHFYTMCREHPEVFVPEIKEVFFFDKEFDRGHEWYAGFFRQAKPSHKAIGEVSHDYLFADGALERIAQDYPSVQLIVFLREPESWLNSRRDWEAGKRDIDVSLTEFCADPLIAPETRIGENLKRCMNLFDRDQVHVFFHEDMRRDIHGFYRRVFTVLGVNPDFQSATLNKTIYAAHEPRWPWLAYFAQRAANVLRALGLQSVLGRIKRSGVTERVLFRKRQKRVNYTSDEWHRLEPYFNRQVGILQDILDENLPVEWTRKYKYDHD